jgi:DNA repair exonuclease SbcCD nuclease subunit
MAKYVFHIADIHIYERNYAHIRHSWVNLLNDIMKMSNYESETILVIAGDIFDHKTYLTAGDVSLFYEMMAGLERARIQTVMIPGNHDYNINNSKGDKIAALVEHAQYKYIIYKSTSGIIEVNNLLFFVHSPIDLGVPRPEPIHDGKVTIAIVHEPLSESQTCSGITFGQQRFAASDFTNIFDMTMLGDIHMPQLLAPNVAYSGSFVQKNKGEGIEHGYMLWDVKKATPIFVSMPQLSVHIKAWALENKLNALPDVSPRSITFHHSDCDSEMTIAFHKQIETKYNQRIIGVFDKTTMTPVDVKAPTNQELSQVITTNLTSMKLNNGQVSRILKMHNDMFKETIQEISADWTIRFLSWSNVYCYGEDNFINFDEIGNLTSMIGPNKIGKSSVIDILMLVLFNQTSRGSKRDALNVNSDSGHIKCVITVANDEYAIERAWIDKKTVAVRVYKNGENITNEDLVSTYTFITSIIGSKRVFINSTAALQQRQFLVDLGSKEIYELVCRMMELDRLRNIEDQNIGELRVINKQIMIMKEKMDTVSNVSKKLDDVRASYGVCSKNVSNISIEMTNICNRQTIVAVDVVEGCEQSILLDTKRQQLSQYKEWSDDAKLDSRRAEVKLLEIIITNGTIELGHLTKSSDDLRSTIKQCAEGVIVMDFTTKFEHANTIDLAQCVERLQKLTATVAVNSSNIELIKTNIASLDTDILNQQPNGINDTLDIINAKLAKAGNRIDLDILRRQLTISETNVSIMRHTPAFVHTIPNEYKCVTVMKNTFNIKKFRTLDLDAELVLLQQAKNDNHINLVEKQVEICNAKKHIQQQRNTATSSRLAINTFHMKWNMDCDCCKQNKLITPKPYDVDIAAAEIEENVATIMELDNDVITINTESDRIQKRIMDIYSFMVFINIENEKIWSEKIADQQGVVSNDTMLYNNALAVNTRIDQLEHDMAAYNAVQKLKMHRVEQIKKLDKYKTEKAKLDLEYIEAAKPIALVEEARVLRERHCIYIHNKDVNERLNVISTNINELTIKLNSAKENLIQCNIAITDMEKHKQCNIEYEKVSAMYDIALASEDAKDEMHDLNNEHNELVIQRANASSELCSLSLEIGKLEQLLAFTTQQENELAVAMQKAADRTVYDKLINHKTGVPESMMKAMCNNVQKQCNIILNDIADFTITVEYDKEITINTVIGDATISAEQSSGYQKFIIDLIMRQVLCSLTLAAHPRILFVDEGFGSLDKNNFEIVCRTVLPNLASHFEKVVIISHIPGIHQHTTTNCEIKKVGDRSQLQFGQIAYNGLVTRVQTDHAEYMKRMREKKDEAKAINITENNRKKQEKLISNAEKNNALLQYAIDKQVEYGESIIDVIDDKSARCRACNKVYKNRKGFAQSHVLTKTHMVSMRTFK